MTLSEPACALLVGRLSAILDKHRGTPEEIGFAAVRALRDAGVTWTDLFRDTPSIGPTVSVCQPARPYIVAWIAYATPAQLAEMAVLLLGPLPPDQVGRYDDASHYGRLSALMYVVHQTYLREREGLAGAAPIGAPR